VIGSEDTLHVSVWKEPDLTATLPVRPDGKISLPLLNDVQAAGLTPMQLAGELTTKLKKFVSDPQVTVVVTQMNSQRVYVTGEVIHSGAMNLTPDMSRFTMKARPEPMPNPRAETEIDVCIPFTYGIVEKFAAEMKKRGIKPEMETYHTGGAWVIRDLIERRLVEPPFLVQTVMGAQTASYPTPENVLQMLKELPEQTIWLCSGIGPFQLPLTTLALLMGGHARVGLEDNLYHSRGRKFVDNAESVKRVVRIAGELNRKISTPAETRKLLGLPSTPLNMSSQRAIT